MTGHSFIASVYAVLALGLLVVLWLLVMYLLLVASRARRMVRYRAKPDFKPTLIEDLPEQFRPQLGEMTRQLLELGFVAVANVTSTEPIGRQVTQCLFVHRAGRERASVFCQITGGRYTSYVGFVTEFTDGTEIKTHTLPPVPGEFSESKSHYESLPIGTSLKELHDRHETNVAKHAPPKVEKVLPPEGEEIEYVAKRHVLARAISMPRRGFVLDPDGEFYRPSRRLALRVAFKTTWPFRLITNWRDKRKKRPGFAIVQQSSAELTG